jgi:cysteine desulfurase
MGCLRNGTNVEQVRRLTGGYFDAAAGIPLHPVAIEALQAAIEDGWADPSRLTGAGRRSAVLLDAARESIADSIGVRAEEVSFVPSGSHALHLGVLGLLAGRRRVGNRLVHSAVEHSAIFKAAHWHREAGGAVDVVGVDECGRVDVDEFVRAAAQVGVAAAALQAANHEVGTRQPVTEVAIRLSQLSVPLMVDASHELVYGAAPANATVFSGDPRLWGGPAGVGLLVVRAGARWMAPLPADEAEFGRSPGVPNVPAIVAAAASLRAFQAEAAATSARLAVLIDKIRAQVPALISDAVMLGDPIDRLPHIVTFSCLYVEGEALLTALDKRGFAVSSGSSCTSDTLTPSHVLVAMGALTSGNVRVSLSPDTTASEVDRFLGVLPDVVAEVREQLPSARPAGWTEQGLANPAGSAAGGIDLAADDRLVDSRGRRCPLPILDLAKALPQVEVGRHVTVLADDPAAASDIAAWCRMRGHELVETGAHDHQTGAYRVRRLH